VTDSAFSHTLLDEGVAALKRDLLSEGGPQISTMRNYRFAILVYKPADEFKVRRLIRTMSDELRAEGWGVLSISLHSILLDRVRSGGPGAVEAIVARERRLFAKGPDRALEYLQQQIVPHIEGPDGIAADVVRKIDEFADQYPERADKTLVLVGRSGALYPFFRSSALLKHIDGKTRNIPVVLLYPGERRDTTGLSFMGELPADRDYRPRIYP